MSESKELTTEDLSKLFLEYRIAAINSHKHYFIIALANGKRYVIKRNRLPLIDMSDINKKIIDCYAKRKIE